MKGQGLRLEGWSRVTVCLAPKLPARCIALREAQWSPSGWTGTDQSLGRRGRLGPETKAQDSGDPSDPLAR